MRSKQKIRSLVSENDLLQFGLFFGSIYLILNYLDAILMIVVALTVCAVGFLFWRRSRRRSQVRHLYNTLTVAISEHESALISYFNQSRTKDQFGNVDDRRWQSHIDTFLRTMVVVDIHDFSTWRKSDIGRQASQMVSKKTLELVEDRRQATPLSHIDAFDLTPLEYENYCAEFLRNEGWVVTMTPATRDGGADFLAEKNGLRLVVQCKRYSQHVGNKAVQEAHSALGLYNGSSACVVAPMGFTKQAQTEALCHSVHLLHHLELPAFSDKLTTSHRPQIQVTTNLMSA